MGERFQKVRNTLDFLILIGYAEIKPELDKVSDYFKGLATIARNPLAFYELYKQEKACRCIDCWERADREICQASRQAEYLL